MNEKIKLLLKSLPKIDEVILLLEKKNIYSRAPREIVKEMSQKVVQKLRNEIVNSSQTDREPTSTALPKFNAGWDQLASSAGPP